MPIGRYLSHIKESTPGTLPTPYTSYASADLDSFEPNQDRGLQELMRSRGLMPKALQKGGILSAPTLSLVGPYADEILPYFSSLLGNYAFSVDTHTLKADELAPDEAHTGGTTTTRTLSILVGLDDQEIRIPGNFIDEIVLRQRGLTPLEASITPLSGKGATDITQTTSHTVQTPTVRTGFGGYDFSMTASGVSGMTSAFRPLSFEIRVARGYDRTKFVAGDGTAQQRRLAYHRATALMIEGSIEASGVITDALVDFLADNNSGLTAVWTDDIAKSLTITLDKVYWTRDTMHAPRRRDVPITRLNFRAYNPTVSTEPIVVTIVGQTSSFW